MCIHIVGVTVTVVSSPAGTPVSGSANSFDYPIMSNVTLTCNVSSNDGIPFTVSSYQWNTMGCYTNYNYNDGVPNCFADGQTTQSVTGTDLTAEDAGTITCSVTIGDTNYTVTSGSFTLRISGKLIYYNHTNIYTHDYIKVK